MTLDWLAAPQELTMPPIGNPAELRSALGFPFMAWEFYAGWQLAFGDRDEEEALQG